MDAEQNPDLRSQLAAYVRAPVVVGFMAALTWMATFYSVVPTAAGATTFTGSRATDVYLLSIVVTVGADGLIWVFSPRVLTLVRRFGPAAAALLMVASTLVLALAHLGGDALAWLAVAATIIAGTSSTTLLLCWALALGGVEARAMFTSLVLAYILSSFMNVFTAVSNDVTNAILSLALPLVSLACLRSCPQTVGPTRFERYTAQDRASGSDLFRAPLRPSPLLWKLSGAFFIWASVNRLFRREYAALVGSDVAIATLVQIVATVAVAVVVLGIVAILTRLPKRFRFESIYRVFFLTMLAGVVLLPVALNGSHAALGSALNTAGYQIFCMFMWSIIAIACHDYPQDALRVFGFTGLFWAGGAAAGVLGDRLLSPAIASDCGALITALAVLLLSGCYTLLFTERDAALLAEIIPTQQRMPFREKCDRVATIYKLSPREHEVLDLLARGRDSAAIQERLSLSASTVQTHRMHIYQKLQIHSRQELLDVIEAQEVDRRG